MDQDLDLASQDQPVQQPPQSVQPPLPQLQLSTDEIFNKLFEEKKMTWIQAMEEVIEWIDLKYPAEDINLLEKFPSFNSFISSYYMDKK